MSQAKKRVKIKMLTITYSIRIIFLLYINISKIKMEILRESKE